MHEREDRCAKSGASWRASCTTRAMASSSSSSIEKLVFIAPLRPGLNHRCSHNFVVVSSPPLPIQYLPGPARTSCLIFRCYGLVYCYGPAPCIFQVPRYREVSRMKILPAKAGRRRGGGGGNDELSLSPSLLPSLSSPAHLCRNSKSPCGGNRGTVSSRASQPIPTFDQYPVHNGRRLFEIISSCLSI